MSVATLSALLAIAIGSFAQAPAAPILLRIVGSSAPPAGGGGGGGVPELDAYVSPYDDLTQLCISPTGAGTCPYGGSVVDFSSLDAVTGFNFMSNGAVLNWLPGTYDWPTDVGTDIEFTSDGSGPTLAGRRVHRPLPGSAAGSVIWVTNNATGPVLITDGFSWNTFDGEEVGFIVTGGGGVFAADAETSIGFEILNFEGTASVDYGTTGSANQGFAEWNGDAGGQQRFIRIENLKFAWDPGSYNANTAVLGPTLNNEYIYRNVEIYHAGRTNYSKHGCTQGTACAFDGDRNNQNIIIERTLFSHDSASGQAWAANENWAFIRDFVLVGGLQFPEGGGDGGAAHWRAQHVTAPIGWTPDVDGGGGFNNGGEDLIMRSSVFGGISHAVADSPDYDWIVTPTLVYAGSSNTALAGPNSTIATPTFAGSDPRTLTDWEVTSSHTGPTGRKLGADITKVGKKSAAAIVPNVYSRMLTTSLNEASNQTWYDDTTIALGTHIRHGFGVYEAAWTSGTGGTPTGVGASRHLFTASNEVTFEAEYYTTSAGAGFAGNTHLFHWKPDSEGAFDAPGDDNPGGSPGNSTYYLEPRQITFGAGNPCYFEFDVRRNQFSAANPANRWTEYANGDAGNLATDADIDVCDGNLHRVRVFMRGNDVGSANGVLEVYVDNVMTLGRTDVEYFTIGGQQFNQLIIAPYLGDLAPANQSLFVGDLRMFNRDW